jgi:hypothetical protein
MALDFLHTYHHQNTRCYNSVLSKLQEQQAQRSHPSAQSQSVAIPQQAQGRQDAGTEAHHPALLAPE